MHTFTFVPRHDGRRFGLLVSACALLGVAPCPSQDASGTVGPAAVPEAGASKHFAQVARHLDLGGLGFGYLDVDGDVDAIAKMLDEAVANLGELGLGEIPPEVAALDFRALAWDLGLSGIDAVGFSSYDAGGVYRNKLYVRAAGGRRGLLKLLGGTSGEFGARALAPQGTDLVIERDLNLAAGYIMARKIMRQIGGDEAEAALEQAMAGWLADFGVTLGDFFARFNTKIVVVLRADDTRRLAVPGLAEPVATPDLLVSVDNLGWILKQLAKRLPPELAARIIEGEGFRELELPMPPAEGDLARFQPVVYEDTKADRVYLATDRAWLEACRGEGARLFDGEDFRTATEGLPTEGNGLYYVSPRFIRELRGLMAQVVPNLGQGGEKVLSPLAPAIEKMLPALEHGIATVQVNDPDGVLVASNSTASIKDIVGPGLLVPLAVGAAVAVPVFAKIQERAMATKDLQIMKQVALGLRMFAIDHGGAYPEKLEEILEVMDVDPSFLAFLDVETGEAARIWYARGLTDSSSAERILLAHPFVRSGRRAVIFADASGDFLDEAAFQELLRAQMPDFEIE